MIETQIGIVVDFFVYYFIIKSLTRNLLLMEWFSFELNLWKVTIPLQFWKYLCCRYLNNKLREEDFAC